MSLAARILYLAITVIAVSPWILGITLACPAKCTCSGTEVDCFNKGLTAIPEGIPSDTTVLNLGFNQITAIGVGAFAGLSRLQTLHLGFNRITAIAAGAFTGLSQLQVLTLFKNQITAIAAGTFTGLSQLQDLGLGGNQITTVPDWAFAGLSQLKVLSLRQNQITEIAVNAFAGLGQLKTLNLLYQISPNPGLPVGKNDLLRYGICGQVADGLDKLYVDDDTTLGLEFDTSLLSTCPSSINAACPLECTCSGTEVDCSSNGLRFIPEGIPSDTTVLYLQGNQITEIPNSVFTGLSQLTRLGLWDNQITEISAGVFQDLSQLEYLNLNGNLITTIANGVFAGLSQLQQLYLSGNQITVIPVNAFAGLSQLEYLYMFENKITTIADGAFAGLSQLTRLYLYQNPGVPLGKNDLMKYGICGQVADGLDMLYVDKDKTTEFDTSLLSTCPSSINAASGASASLAVIVGSIVGTLCVFSVL